MVPDQQVENGVPAAPITEQAIARVPRLGLHTTPGFLAAPGKHTMFDAARAQPIADQGRFIGRTGAQAVIDRQGRDRPAARHGPFLGTQAQGKTVGAARHGDGECRRRFEGAKGLHQGSKFRGPDGLARC